jgi:hypothetical protein
VSHDNAKEHVFLAREPRRGSRASASRRCPTTPRARPTGGASACRSRARKEARRGSVRTCAPTSPTAGWTTTSRRCARVSRRAAGTPASSSMGNLSCWAGSGGARSATEQTSPPRTR